MICIRTHPRPKKARNRPMYIQPAALAVLALSLLLQGCITQATEPMKTVDYVDLERFMGDWHIIASVPTLLDKAPYNAIERYEMNPDGTIATTYMFRDGAFDGPRKEMSPKAFVQDEQTNAVWGMQFVWPIKADYRIVYLESDYSITVIARKRRDYVWIMARAPKIPDGKLQELMWFVEGLGYDKDKIRMVPQQTPNVSKARASASG